MYVQRTDAMDCIMNLELWGKHCWKQKRWKLFLYHRNSKCGLYIEFDIIVAKSLSFPKSYNIVIISVVILQVIYLDLVPDIFFRLDTSFVLVGPDLQLLLGGLNSEDISLTDERSVKEREPTSWMLMLYCIWCSLRETQSLFVYVNKKKPSWDLVQSANSNSWVTLSAAW